MTIALRLFDSSTRPRSEVLLRIPEYSRARFAFCSISPLVGSLVGALAETRLKQRLATTANDDIERLDALIYTKNIYKVIRLVNKLIEVVILVTACAVLALSAGSTVTSIGSIVGGLVLAGDWSAFFWIHFEQIARNEQLRYELGFTRNVEFLNSLVQ